MSDQSVPISVENGGASSPPTKRLRGNEEVMAVPMVAPLSQWTVPASRESRDCINVVRGCAETYFRAELDRADKAQLINSSIGGCH